MKIKLLKATKIGGMQYKADQELEVTKDLAKKLISSKTAKEITKVKANVSAQTDK